MGAEKEGIKTLRILWHLEITEDEVLYKDAMGEAAMGQIRGQLLENLRLGASQEGITLEEAVKIYLDTWHYGL